MQATFICSKSDVVFQVSSLFCKLLIEVELFEPRRWAIHFKSVQFFVQSEIILRYFSAGLAVVEMFSTEKNN